MAVEDAKVMPTSTQCRSADARSSVRSSVYLGATLYGYGAPTPTRIRNMSADGALVEAAVVPEGGALVQLVRGSLIVHGLVAWSVEGRCGVKFSGTVDVQQWRAAPNNDEQQRVDDVVKLVKAGAVPLPVREHGDPRWSENSFAPGEGIADDLRRVTELLDQLGDVLAGDPDVVIHHAIALQNLDISMQMIAAVDAILAGASESGDDSKLAGLRRSADQALKRANSL